MRINRPYQNLANLPEALPIFPLSGALLLPRGQLPLNIFEPRYVAMIDDVIKSSRLVGMIQPAEAASVFGGKIPLHRVGCVGRIVQFGETGDGRYLLTLFGVARFGIVEELAVTTLYRQCKVDYTEFPNDLVERAGESDVDRAQVIEALRRYSEARDLQIDWTEVEKAHTEILVNALSTISPFGSAEKQALLEAPDLKTRAEVLVAITAMELARGSGTSTSMQ